MSQTQLGARYLIIGSGIVGMSIARELLERGESDIIILDKEDEPGRHASGRNSGILHAGIYYAPDSFKARFCLQGNREMRAYCQERGLPLLASGKVVVATRESELETLRELYERAGKNGARVELINSARLKEVEPAARGLEAILSHDTATVAPRKILKSLQNELETAGVKFFFNAIFLDATPATNRIKSSAGAFEFEHLINAAGSHADRVARAFGVGKQYRLIPFKGAYRELAPRKAELVRGNIYPVPDIRNPFLGVHFSRMVDGRVFIGPTATPVFAREAYERSGLFSTEAIKILAMDGLLFLRNKKFRSNALAEIRKYWPRAFYREAARIFQDLQPADLLPSKKAGIRPQLVDWKSGELIMDFRIEKGPNSLHVLNAISPAFTAAFPAARYIVDLLEH